MPADFETGGDAEASHSRNSVQLPGHGVMIACFPTMHCFNAGLAQAQEVVDLGHFVSFSGVVTFENASEVREATKSVPIERIMVETNAPYFAPAPNRTKRCEPAFIRETAAFIANLRGMSLAAFAAQTTQNAQAFFEFNT
jgi:TatD DNase family protein